MARGDELTFLAKEGRVVDHEEHRHGGLVNSDGRQGLRVLDVADGVANLELVEADDSTDIATLHLVDTLVTHAIKDVELLDPGLLHRAVAMGNGDLHAVLQGATMNATYSNTASVARIVERGDEHLRGTLNLLGSRDNLDDLI